MFKTISRKTAMLTGMTAIVTAVFAVAVPAAAAGPAAAGPAASPAVLPAVAEPDPSPVMYPPPVAAHRPDLSLSPLLCLINNGTLTACAFTDIAIDTHRLCTDLSSGMHLKTLDTLLTLSSHATWHAGSHAGTRAESHWKVTGGAGCVVFHPLARPSLLR